MYAPENNDILRGGAYKCSDRTIRVKVSMYMVTQFENKTDTIVETRTYMPRFDWDPEVVNRFKGKSLASQQGMAGGYSILNTIDNHTWDNYIQSQRINGINDEQEEDVEEAVEEVRNAD